MAVTVPHIHKIHADIDGIPDINKCFILELVRRIVIIFTNKVSNTGTNPHNSRYIVHENPVKKDSHASRIRRNISHFLKQEFLILSVISINSTGRSDFII